MSPHPAAPIERLTVSAFTVPTDLPESDGTLEWDSTTMVLVEVQAGGQRGLGYSYADLATAQLATNRLASAIVGIDAFAPTRAWDAMVRCIRNLGRPGVASMAIAAVDVALWDLKARLLDVPLATLLGVVRDAVPVYGSGGFTSYTSRQLHDQLAGWVDHGITMAKMKVGRDPGADVDRVRAAREAVGSDTSLFVDANGAYSRKVALCMADAFAQQGVTWFEEPVSSDDLDGLRLLRDRVPSCIEVAAGEYGYDLPYFRRMLDAGAVDVLQADATRCAGVTGFMQVDALCRAWSMPLSAHTAPSLHAHLCCAATLARHVEYFHDHVRIEHMLFDGAPTPVGGLLAPDWSRPGLGLELKWADAQQFAV